ncbi:MAG: DnaJ domain-containing protein [Patescibacteria group bacterium]
MAKNYYEILGVSKSASADEIKRAYRKLAHEHHPDKGGGAAAEAKFKEINEAYQVLSNPQKRQSYDTFGTADGAQFGGANPGGFGGFGNMGGFDFGSGGVHFGGGLGDLFEGIFGQTMAQVQVEVEISITQAVLGDTLHLQVENKKVDLAIPAGTQDGHSFRLRGQGRAFRGGVGDLIVSVRIRVPRHLSREQRELYEKLKNLE